MNQTQATRLETSRPDSQSRSGELGQARVRLFDPSTSLTQPPALSRQASREQRVAALNFALDIGQTLNRLLNGSKREITKMAAATPSTSSAPKESGAPKTSRPPQAAQLRKVVTASRASASHAITRTKQRRNSTSVVGKPRFGRRPPPKRPKREPEGG